MTGPEDYYEFGDVAEGESVMTPPDLFGCKLGPHT